jgi:hypothetical protein
VDRNSAVTLCDKRQATVRVVIGDDPGDTDLCAGKSTMCLDLGDQLFD